MNGDAPRASTGARTAFFIFRFSFLTLKMLFFPQRKDSTQTAETVWLKMVARAAPWTPIWKPKMKIGSRMIFNTAPMSTVFIPVLAKP